MMQKRLSMPSPSPKILRAFSVWNRSSSVSQAFLILGLARITAALPNFSLGRNGKKQRKKVFRQGCMRQT